MASPLYTFLFLKDYPKCECFYDYPKLSKNNSAVYGVVNTESKVSAAGT